MKSPAFQFYATDYLGSQRVQMLNLEEEGAYIRLLCFCWQHGSIPSKPSEIARLVGKGCSSNLARVVAAMFTPHPTDGTKLVHDRLESEKNKQAAWKEKCSAGGKKSAESKKNHPRVVEQPLEVTLQDSTHIPIPSPIPSPLRCTNKQNGFPALADVIAAGDMMGMTKADSEQFWHHFESSGWIDKNGHPVQNWRSKQATWKTVARAAPLEKNHHATEGGGQTQSHVTLAKEYERVIFRIKQLQDGCAQDAMGSKFWNPKDKAERDRMIIRRNELRGILGVVA